MREYVKVYRGENTNTKTTTLRRTSISDKRIEKLKKTFQPFWMREMGAHQIKNEENSNPHNVLNQI